MTIPPKIREVGREMRQALSTVLLTPWPHLRGVPAVYTIFFYMAVLFDALSVLYRQLTSIFEWSKLDEKLSFRCVTKNVAIDGVFY